MKDVSLYGSRILWVVMAYGLIAACWNLAYSPAFIDEATNIFMGRQVLAGAHCPLCDRNAGSVMIYPVLSALGDKAGGLAGARAIGTVFVLGLAVVLYSTGRVLFSVKHGILCAILFFLNGTILYLSTTATGDMVAAFFLGLSFLLMVLSEKQRSESRSGLLLFSGAASLFISSVTMYTVAVFIPPIALYVFWKHRFQKALLFFLLPLSVFLSAYIYIDVLPRWNTLASIFSLRFGEGIASDDLGSRIFRSLGIPYLLAVFGLFNGEGKGTAFLLIALSTPLVIHHIIFGDGQAIERDVVYSIVFLVPAMALGVDHMGSLFSSDTTLSWVKPFFTAAVLVILWVFGTYEFRWFQKQHPDLTQVFSFLERRGSDGMTVVIDADNSYADYLYRYSLERSHRASRFVQISGRGVRDMERDIEKEKPDFVVVDKRSDGVPGIVRNVPSDIDTNFSLVEKFDIPFSLGIQKIEIFRRR